MNKKALTKITTSALVLVLVAIMIISTCIGAFGGGSSSSANFIQKYGENIKTNFESYLDGSVVQSLPGNVKDDDHISVIFNLNIPALLDEYGKTDKSQEFYQYVLSDEADKIRDEISLSKIEILKELNSKNVKFTAGENYSAIISGFEIVIQAKDFKTVCDALGDRGTAIVGEVYNTCETQLVENKVNFYESTGIFDSSDFKYDGTGMVVAVLDTGLDYTHSAFSVNNFTADRSKLGLTKDKVAALLADTKASGFVEGLKVDDVYMNEKVPYAFDYADKDPDVYSLHNNHGTHVSGVIVGKDDVITGVAPNAQVIAMKTFSDIEESARTSWILSALEDCVILGVDVINMSLGTACGFSRETDKEAINGNVYQKIRDAGISLVVAASNSFNSAYGSDKNGNLGLTSNPDTSTVGSPSTYDGAMSVASINGVKTPYILFNGKIMYFLEATNSRGDEKHFFEEILPEGTEEMEIEYVVVPGAGRAADYTGLDVKGKIVLVRRGSNTFEEKANAAQAQGAAGIIIYNNVSGDIRMNAGITTIPICSMSQDDGEVLAEAGGGKLKISLLQTAGPFISDFSSWGPSPDLSIKPEITAHGGNILSAITGGSYDRLSGTSMACPNLAGVTILLRQYVKDEFPSIADDNVKVAALVNQLLMSTADVVYNTNGLPYAVRKQGAGLANLVSASTTKAYIMTYDREDGSVMDKSKIELGDDPSKTGEYVLKFSINNFGSVSLSYDLSVIVLTEGVSETETVRGDTTVSEEGYLLEGATIEIVKVENGQVNGNNITVDGGKTADVQVKVTLSEENKNYLDSSFENGIYVEGFVQLDAKSGTEVDLGVPYLAFYGDWTKSPMFDLDYFETNKDELDDGVSEDDKVKPDAYATRPIGGLSSDFVSYLGSFYFLQDPNNKIISANRDYIALSNIEGTVHSLRFVWAGMLRNADKIVITITDDATGEVIFETVDYDIRKSYGDGGSTIYPANVEIEFDTADYNLKNNSTYTVKLQGYLDYGDGGLETNLNNTFEFPLYIDFEAPAVTGCEFYTEYDKDAKRTRLFAKVAVYDNHYAMALQFGYVGNGVDENGNPIYEMNAFDTYPTPVYSQRNGTTYVEYELTDYIYQIKENAVIPGHQNTFTVACYDYALNQATYEIALPNEFVDFYFEESAEGIKLSPNQTYALNPIIYPNVETNPDNKENPWAELFTYSSSNPKAVRIVNNKLVALEKGVSTITAIDPNDNTKRASFKVTVLGKDDEGYKRYDRPVVDVFRLDGYETKKAFFFLSNDQREIGATGDIVKFSTDTYSLSMYPSESVQLLYEMKAFFPDNTTIQFQSNNESIVAIDQNGVITAKAKGFSSVTMKVLLDGKSTYYSRSISIEVKDPYITNGPMLTNYFGLGGTVEIPSRLLLTTIGQYAFSNFDYIEKTEDDEISEESPDATKIWYIGENTITKVIIPEGVETISQYAFANLTALEEVVIPSTLEAIEYGAFYGCSKLKTISYKDPATGKTTSNSFGNVKLINQGAFAGCNLTGTYSFDNARAIGNNAFAGNKRLSAVVFPETLQSIGSYAFANNTALKTVTVKAELVKYGAYVFTGCTALTSIEMNASVIPEGAFLGCTALKSVKIGKDVSTIGEYAFAETQLSSFEIDKANKAFKANNNYITTLDGATLVVVAPTAKGKLAIADTKITSIASGAFGGNKKITAVEIPSVVSVGDYVFADCTALTSIKLGTLTHVGDYAFFNSGITSLPSFEKLNEIGKYSFAGTKITQVEIPDGMLVKEGAFCECKKLASVVIGNNAILETGAFMLDRSNSKVEFYYPFAGNTDDKRYYYVYTSDLTSLTIGDNVVLGPSAFMGAASLEKVTLGEGVEIGNMAFYNASKLKEVINLNKAKSIGESAFSGDELYEYEDESLKVYVVVDNNYVYRYYAPAFEEIDLSGIEKISKGSFALCKSLKKVILGDNLTVIPELAFYGCNDLELVDLSKVTEVKENAFAETAIEKIDLSSATVIEKYAFVYIEELKELILNPNGVVLGEGVFAYAGALKEVENLNKVTDIGAYAFAYTDIKSADLSGAEKIGDQAFLKESLTQFDVTLSEKLTYLGDNPFAMCKLTKPFAKVVTTEFNGKEYKETIYTFDISDRVKVVDGSLYCMVENGGYELITYVGIDDSMVTVADNTVRITAYAFAGSDVVRVGLPYTVKAIGHKAFFDCDKLVTVVFTSYESPVLEEEMDMDYYHTYDNIPATGTYEFTGNIVKVGIGIVPYYMWNATNYAYVDQYYGANFMDYIGHIDRELIMIRPVNGQHYETFIYGQYFGTVIDGLVAADDTTLAAIEAIANLPKSVQLSDEALVILARQAYNKIATKDQQALVTNYADLVTAENRIKLLKDTPVEDNKDEIVDENNGGNNTGLIVLVIIESVLIVGVIVLVIVLMSLKDVKITPKTKKEKTEVKEEKVVEKETTEVEKKEDEDKIKTEEETDAEDNE